MEEIMRDMTQSTTLFTTSYTARNPIASEIMNSDDDIPTDEMYFDELVNIFLAKKEN